MANVTIDIPDDSLEFEELQFMVQETQITDPTMTPKKYVTNMVMGYLKNRVTNIYKSHAAGQSLETLKEKFGSLDSVR